MRKNTMVKCIVLFSSFCILIGPAIRAEAAEEKKPFGFQSLLIVCPYIEVEKQQLIEDAFVQAFSKIIPAEKLFSYIKSLSQGKEVNRKEFINWVNERKIEALLYIQIQGISATMETFGEAPAPFSSSSEGDEPDDGGYYPDRPRPAKTWFQVSLMDSKTGKPVWKETLMALGDVGFSLKNVAKSMAKKTAKQLKKTGLLELKK